MDTVIITLNNEVSNDEEKQNEIIKPIGKDTVHRICSGQVVLSLSIAVKELVENAIDAGANIIDVRLKEYGADSIEVVDNGSGVLTDNFQVLTLKHYTSKLREFSDLENIETLGFRGEALSSLCALSDLTVITRHRSAEVGSRISYGQDGTVINVTPTPRELGTTVTLSNLFSTLPVRRKEFLKNLKREFNRMCQLLYAYCLVSKGIKFTCTNMTAKGFKNTIVVTEGHSTVRENILSVFGAKQISSLIEVELVTPEESILTEYDVEPTPGKDQPFSFEFFISSVMHGCGRSSTDRQFYFINSRPCEPTKVMKLINEMYKQYNSSQYPFVYLNIRTKSSIIDVNVTPDKRQVFLEKEKYLLATIKASLIESFKSFPSTYKMQNTDILKYTQEKSCTVGSKGMKRSLSECGIKKGSILEMFKKRSKSNQNTDCNEYDTFPSQDIVGVKDKLNWIEDSQILTETACKLMKDVKNKSDLYKPVASETTFSQEDSYENGTTSISSPAVCDVKVSLDAPLKTVTNRRYVFIKTSVKDIRKAIEDDSKVREEKANVQVRFRSQIAPECNKTAEEELQKQISKDSFKRMSIVGQFNLGFIITKLNSDLFIIDQHATDEKYNFEHLQLTTVLENQKLVSPKPLELTAGNECLLIENEKVFNKNGFMFRIDHTAPCTKKVSLTAIPMSKNFVFGKDDIDEMLFMLQDSGNSGGNCRPSRVRAMFASRACRKSVMIGKPLSNTDMRKLVDHMSEIDQPWNCPHGRPTMRHLINLDLLTR